METMASFKPFTIKFTIDPITFEPKEEIIKRTLSSMKAAYADQSAADALLSAGEDPTIVEVFMAPVPSGEGFLMANINMVFPGKVGDEYFMTKGHIHDDPLHSPEIYITVKGQGKLVLQNLEGEVNISDMSPETISYIPAPWAHRCVNTGNEPLVYLGVFPADTKRDYSFDSKKFKKIVVERNGSVEIIDSHSSI